MQVCLFAESQIAFSKTCFVAHKYHSRHEFLVDVQQILENCILYNGKDSPFTQKAEQLVKICKATLDEYDEHLTQHEQRISLAQERAFQDDDQTWMGGDEENYTLAEADRTVSVFALSLDYKYCMYGFRVKPVLQNILSRNQMKILSLLM